jgi:glycine/D-amino acid oxidase-like deaminating enzyme
MTVPPRLNSPYWLEGADTSFPTLTSELEVDVAVIGAGITGCSAAYLLKQAGQSVALLETNRIGYGATGYTTAKLTVGHGLVYADLIKSHGVEAATLYARSNHEALEQIALIVQAESDRVRLRASDKLRLCRVAEVCAKHRARGRGGLCGGRRRQPDDADGLAVPGCRGDQS